MATHGKGRKRPTVLADVLTPPRPGDVLLRIYQPVRRSCRPYDPRTSQLPGCLTTNGGGVANVHPSGTRDFNLREMAQCQSFPGGYRFWGGPTSIKRQIGNAVPPRPFQPFLREVVRTLSTFDGYLSGAVQKIRCSRYGSFASSSPRSVSVPSQNADDSQGRDSCGVIDLLAEPDRDASYPGNEKSPALSSPSSTSNPLPATFERTIQPSQETATRSPVWT